MTFVHKCTAKIDQPNVLKLLYKLPWKLETSCSCKTGTLGALNFPAHKTGIVSCWYSNCTRRYKCVKRVWSCVVVLGVIKHRFPTQTPPNEPLCIGCYYGDNLFFVCVRVHTHCWSLTSLRCVWSGHTCWTVGWLQPLNPLVRFVMAFMRTHLEKERKATSE